MSEFLTVAQARERLRQKGVHLGVGGVYRLMKRGLLTHVRLNRLYITDLDGFLAQQAQASTTPTSAEPVPAPTRSVERVPTAMSLLNPKRRRFGTPDRARRSAS
jgi:hypothetical protein